MAVTLACPFLLLAGGRHHCTASWRGRIRREGPFFKVYRPLAGAAELLDGDGRVAVLRPGRLIIIPAHQPFGYRCARSMTVDWLHVQVLDGPLALALSCRQEPWSQTVTPGAEADQILSAFCPLLPSAVLRPGWRLPEGDPSLPLRLQALLLRLLAAALPALPEVGDRRLAAALSWSDHHRDRPMDTGALAAELGWSDGHFRRRFKAVMGQTPQSWHEQARLLAARQLLADASLGIAEVASRCGWQDPLYFSRCFRRHHGCSPRAWRREGGLP